MISKGIARLIGKHENHNGFTAPDISSLSIMDKADIATTGKKDSGIGIPASWFIYGGTGSNNALTIKRALRFYDQAAPVATAIDWINDEFKTLPLVMKTGDKDVTDTHPILEFLQQPNDDMTREDFLETVGAYFLITNEVYIIATGRPDREPAELIPVSPEFVSVYQGEDGFIKIIKVQQLGMGVMTFTRNDGDFRFFNSDMSAEIWQIKGFSAITEGAFSNSEYNGSNIMSTRGRSKLSSIHNEINQYIEIARHNLATLDNGLLPSGVIELPENTSLTDEQFAKLQAQIVNYYQGAKNAGKALILDNGMKFIPMGIKPKDMNFEKLTNFVTITMFNRYKVPLPLISPDNMTLANMETAKLGLYDNCVIPLAGRLLRELTNFLAPRFNLQKNQLLCANLDDVPCMQIRHMERMEAKKKLDIYTTNQLLVMDGEEASHKPGYDDIYIPWTLVPIGTPPVIQTPSENAPDKPLRKNMVALLENQKDDKGNRLYTDSEILQLTTRALGG